MPKTAHASSSAAAAEPSSVLVLGTRGLKARHRHLQRDLLRLLPHGQPGSKLDTSAGLGAVVTACEDADCSSALLLDARDSRRLYMWAANVPDGPSAMLRVHNVHTVNELNLDARRCAGVRNLLSFDAGFDLSPDRRVLKALLIRTLGTPLGATKSSGGSGAGGGSSKGVERVKHTLSFSWVDDHIWLRVYRIGTAVTGETDVEEIGPRLVLEPIRIIASGFGGAVLHTNENAETAKKRKLEEALWSDQEDEQD